MGQLIYGAKLDRAVEEQHILIVHPGTIRDPVEFLQDFWTHSPHVAFQLVKFSLYFFLCEINGTAKAIIKRLGLTSKCPPVLPASFKEASACLND
jgi:hypothetical protein